MQTPNTVPPHWLVCCSHHRTLTKSLLELFIGGFLVIRVYFNLAHLYIQMPTGALYYSVFLTHKCILINYFMFFVQPKNKARSEIIQLKFELTKKE